MFSGLSGNAVLGGYRIFARSVYAEDTIAWTLTATVNGVVEWVEEGEFVYMSLSDYSDTGDDRYTDRRLFGSTDDDTDGYTSYSRTYLPQSDTFIVTLNSYDPAGCQVNLIAGWVLLARRAFTDQAAIASTKSEAP
ncbi:MAG: hypothetical protein ABJC87_00015 [Roseobacter sp.]